MIRSCTCVVITCDGCDDPWEDGTPHFDSEAEAVEYVRGIGWLVTDATHLCEGCAAKADCAATGHQWGDWWDPARTAAGQPYRRRYCEHCNKSDYDPPWEHLMAVHEAAEVVGKALESDGGVS